MTDEVLFPEQPEGPEERSVLYDRVYGELRRMAQAQMADQKIGHTLQPTALVHEVWLRLGTESPMDRGEFFSLAGTVMRRVLVDHARRRGAEKRQGDRKRVALEVESITDALAPEALLSIDEAVERLMKDDPELGRLAQLRCFAGLDNKEVSDALDVPLRTVQRHWKTARAYIMKCLGEEPEG